MLYLAQTMLPFRGQKRRLQRFRQHGDEGLPDLRRDQVRDLLGLSALHKAGGHQLFHRFGAGCRRPDAFSFRIFGHIFYTRLFHRLQQRILGIVLRRRGLASLDRNRVHV